MIVWRHFQAPFCSNFLFLESFGCLVSIGSNFVRFRATMVSTPPNYSTTHHGNARAPLSLYVSVWENMDVGAVLYLRCVTRIWVDFMEITKGKWSLHQSLGFSRCDWSPDSVWFYYRSKAKKKVVFPNLMCMGKKKSWFLSLEVWLHMGKVLGTTQRLFVYSLLFW